MKKKKSGLTREFWERDAEQKRRLQERIEELRREIEADRQKEQQAGGSAAE